MDRELESPVLTLEEKYPELTFLHVFQGKKSSEKVVYQPFCSVKEKIAAPLLLFYGVTDHIEPLRKLIEEEEERALFFIEDDLRRLADFLQTPASEFLLHPKVTLKIQLPHIERDEFYQDLAVLAGGRPAQLFNLKPEEGSFEEIRKLFFRKATLTNALHSELLLYPKLFRNLRKNFQKMVGAFDVGQMKNAFSGLPAIICGAGPSLSGLQGEIRAAKDRALIFAGGSTIVSLNRMNIMPHMAFAFDPNPEEYARLRYHSSFDTPLVFANRVQSDIFRFSVGPLGYAVTGSGGALEHWIEDKLGIDDPAIYQTLSKEALSVTAIALQTAVYFGCDPIYLVGVDLKYSGKKRYSGDVAPKMQLALEEVREAANLPVWEGEHLTAMRFLMERDVIDEVASQNPNITLFDGSGEGLPFHKIAKKRLTAEALGPKRDIEGLVWEQIEKTPLGVTKQKLDAAFKELRESLERSKNWMAKLVEELETSNGRETARAILYQHELESEEAYQVLLKGTFSVVSTTMFRQNPGAPQGEIEKKILQKMQSILADFSALC